MKYTLLVIMFSLVVFSCAKEDFEEEVSVTSNPKDIAILTPEAVVISENENLNLQEYDKEYLVFTKGSVYEDSISAGSILVSGVTDLAPRGYLRKVVAIDDSGQDRKYITEQANLSEAFEELGFSINTTANLDEFRTSCTEVNNTWDFGEGLSSTLTSEACMSSELAASLDSTINGQDKAFAGFKTVDFNYSGNLNFNFLQEHTDSERKTIADVRAGKVLTIFIGYIPVVFTPHGIADVVFECASLQGNVDIPFDFTIEGYEVFLMYNKDLERFEYATLDQFQFKKRNIIENIEWNFTAELEFGLDLIYEYQLYDSESASLGFNWKNRLKPSVEFAENASCILYANLNIDLTSALAIRYNFFAKDGAEDYDLFGGRKYTKNLFHFEECVDCEAETYQLDIELTGECDNQNTPDDFTDDIGEISLMAVKIYPSGGIDIEEEFILYIDDVLQAGTWKYHTEYFLPIGSGSHEFFIKDADEPQDGAKGCQVAVDLNVDCESGELEEIEEGGPPPLCNDHIVDSRDNQFYCYLDVVNAAGEGRRWLRRNLRYAVSNTANIGIFVNDNPSNWKKGKLYTWDEVKDDNICPQGYRMASVADWNHLFATVKEKNNLGEQKGTSPYLKGPSFWRSGEQGNGGALYSKFFELLPNGYYTTFEDEFLEYEKSANIWTLDPYVDNNGNVSEKSVISMNADGDSEYVFEIPVVKEAFMLGCRCVQDL